LTGGDPYVTVEHYYGVLAMNPYLKVVLMALGMLVVAFFIYQMVMVISPASDLFAPP